MATRQSVAVTGEDIAADRAAEAEFLNRVDNRLVSRVESGPKRSVVSVQPYDAQTLTPDSTRTPGS